MGNSRWGWSHLCCTGSLRDVRSLSESLHWQHAIARLIQNGNEPTGGCTGALRDNLRLDTFNNVEKTVDFWRQISAVLLMKTPQKPSSSCELPFPKTTWIKSPLFVSYLVQQIYTWYRWIHIIFQTKNIPCGKKYTWVIRSLQQKPYYLAWSTLNHKSEAMFLSVMRITSLWKVAWRALLYF